METPAGHPERPGPGANSRATVLGSLTIQGRPERVGQARAFVAATLNSKQIEADADAATLLTSEIVTNAIQHTKSGLFGGTVTIVVIGVPNGVLIEIIDDGSSSAPIVKGDLYAAEGHGLFLVQEIAAQWGYLRDSAGTTVWFHLPNAGEPQQAAVQADPPAGHDRAHSSDRQAPVHHEHREPDTQPYHAQPIPLWAAASTPSASATA